MLQVRRKHALNWAKPLRKLSRIDRYEHVERSMRMFISTVMNMWNGRYETTFSRVLRDKRLVLKQLYSRVQTMKTWHADNEGMGCRR